MQSTINISEKIYKEATKAITGGVNSPSRSFKKVGLNYPLFIQKAEGAYLYDKDNNKYIDYMAAFGPVILGHAHPSIANAITQTASTGVLYGAPHEQEVLFANMIKQAIPQIEQLRFVNSGTEAVMTTVRLARAYTKRAKIIKFAGCYHGHFDLALIEAGSGPATLGISSSAGLTPGVAEDVITLTYNDLSELTQTLDSFGEQVAAILIEPIVGNFGLVLPDEDFLKNLHKLAKQHGALVIYDEVITAFRFRYGGAQNIYNTSPDLTALGKIIGGGLPIGAYGGRKEIMQHIAPEGTVYQAGTMAGNPLSMAAGIACLQELNKPGFYDQIEQLAVKLVKHIKASAKKYGLPITVNSLGGAFAIYFTDNPVFDYNGAQRSDEKRFAKLFRELLKHRIYIAPSKYEVWFLTAAHSDHDIEQTIKAIDKIFSSL